MSAADRIQMGNVRGGTRHYPLFHISIPRITKLRKIKKFAMQWTLTWTMVEFDRELHTVRHSPRLSGNSEA